LWNSSSIAEIKGDPSKSISYKITTSVMYEIKDDETGQTLYGNLKKTVTIVIKSREVKLRSFFPETNMMTST
jgi:hypothetical protein